MSSTAPAPITDAQVLRAIAFRRVIFRQFFLTNREDIAVIRTCTALRSAFRLSAEDCLAYWQLLARHGTGEQQREAAQICELYRSF